MRWLIPLLLALCNTACVPMVLSVYEPESGPVRVGNMCNWKTVNVLLYDRDGVDIEALFTSSPSIGLEALKVRLAPDIQLRFAGDQVTVMGDQFEYPLRLDIRQSLYGHLVPLGLMTGPLVTGLHIMYKKSARPDRITVSLPPLIVNGREFEVEPIKMRLVRSPALVALCL